MKRITYVDKNLKPQKVGTHFKTSEFSIIILKFTHKSLKSYYYVRRNITEILGKCQSLK